MRVPETAEWKATTIQEVDSLKNFGVYTLDPKSTTPPGKIVGSRWVFTREADGILKARIVAQGWNVVPVVDCGGISVQSTDYIASECACHRGGEELGGSPTIRANGVLQRKQRRRLKSTPVFQRATSLGTHQLNQGLWSPNGTGGPV